MSKSMWHHSSIKKLINQNPEKDPVKIVRNKAKEITLIGMDHGWSGPPFDPIELVQILGYKIRPNEAIKDARIIPVDDSFKIEYNPIQNSRRINFSIAHELAHTFFPDCSKSIKNRENKNRSNWELEFLCDIGAAEILLPYGKFAEDANKVSLELDSLLYLSDKYSASLESIFLRFCEIVEKPCAIIVASFIDGVKGSLEINYSKSSRSFDISIDKKFKIPNESVVYECKEPGWTAYEKETWESLNHQPYLVHSIGLAKVKNDAKSRVGIFLVPEGVNEKEIEEIYEVTGDATEPRGEGDKIIAQVVNTSAAVGFGFGRAMANKWSTTKKELKKWKNKNEFQLGNTQLLKVEDHTYVCQMLAQEGIKKKSGTPLSYQSLRFGLIDLRNYAKKLNADVHMPRIGSGQAGGDWDIILGIIYEELVQHGIGVTVYNLPSKGRKKVFNENKELNLFG